LRVAGLVQEVSQRAVITENGDQKLAHLGTDLGGGDSQNASLGALPRIVALYGI
jgi:hypothetical protein